MIARMIERHTKPRLIEALDPIKRGFAPKLSRGFHQACHDLNPARRFVIYGGVERFPLNPNIEAIGLSELAKLLKSGGTKFGTNDKSA